MCLTITWIKLCRLSVGKYFLERAAGIEPASSVWKTEVLTITQRPLTNCLLFHTLGGVKTAMTDAARKNDDMGGKRPIADLGASSTMLQCGPSLRTFAANAKPCMAELTLCGHSDLFSSCTNVRFCGSHILHQPFRVQRFHHSTSVRERPKLRGVWAVPSSR